MQAIEGIILKTVRLQESCLIVTLFSKEQGIIGLVVYRGAQPLSPLMKIEAEIVTSDKELKKCRHVQAICSFQGLRLSLEKLEYAALFARWALSEIPRHEAAGLLYELFDQQLMALCQESDSHAVAIHFMRSWKQLEGTLSHHDDDTRLLKQLRVSAIN